MVNESIRHYLITNTGIVEEQINLLFNNEENKLEINLSKSQIEKIRNSLDKVKIVDPACGSGAFLMEVLNKMVYLYTKLDKLESVSIKDENLSISKNESIYYNPDKELSIKALYIGNKNFELNINNKGYGIFNSEDMALFVKGYIYGFNKKRAKKTIANIFSQGKIENNPTFNTIKSRKNISRIVDSETGEIIWQYSVYNVENKTRPYRNAKSIDEDLNYAKNLYNLKKQIISNSIYGVDIQPIAIEITKLRCFLSLIVDEKIDKNEDNWGILPLPNFDYKIMQGIPCLKNLRG